MLCFLLFLENCLQKTCYIVLLLFFQYIFFKDVAWTKNSWNWQSKVSFSTYWQLYKNLETSIPSASRILSPFSSRFFQYYLSLLWLTYAPWGNIKESRVQDVVTWKLCLPVLQEKFQWKSNPVGIIFLHVFILSRSNTNANLFINFPPFLGSEIAKNFRKFLTIVVQHFANFYYTK